MRFLTRCFALAWVLDIQQYFSFGSVAGYYLSSLVILWLAFYLSRRTV